MATRKTTNGGTLKAVPTKAPAKAAPAKATKAAPARKAAAKAPAKKTAAKAATKLVRKADDDKALDVLREAQAALDHAKVTLDHAKTQRDALVVKLAAQGFSFRQIGLVLGLSPVRANRIAAEVKAAK
jgi:hypothetical protein